MFSLYSDSPESFRDVADFVATLNVFNEENGFFDHDAEIFFARAPGRLDVMGGIADYSGSLVLQRPTSEAAFVAVQRSADSTISIVSVASGEDNRTQKIQQPLLCSISLGELKTGALNGYVSARNFFRHNRAQHWAAYVAGIFCVLQQECRVNFDSGARILVASNVPEGKGVSSSAALETATIKAVCGAFKIELADSRQSVLLCQKAENEIVGAPCGVMDQMASACGESDKLLALRCQPAELETAVEIPAEIEFWGIDSGIRHSIAGADYGTVRAGAFIGYRIITEIANLPIEKLANNLVKIGDEQWCGYLANISPNEFEQNFRARLPDKITGAEFLRKYHGTIDNNSVIEAEREYPVLTSTAHPVYENWRVEKFRQLLMLANAEPRLNELGELMYESHRSYSACGLGSDGTDLLVELVKQAGAENGLYGAKITGGGSGGTVAVLGRRNASAAVAAVARQYEQLTKRRPRIFSGTSPGADFFGFSILRARKIWNE